MKWSALPCEVSECCRCVWFLKQGQRTEMLCYPLALGVCRALKEYGPTMMNALHKCRVETNMTFGAPTLVQPFLHRCQVSFLKPTTKNFPLIAIGNRRNINEDFKQHE